MFSGGVKTPNLLESSEYLHDAKSGGHDSTETYLSESSHWVSVFSKSLELSQRPVKFPKALVANGSVQTSWVFSWGDCGSRCFCLEDLHKRPKKTSSVKVCEDFE